MANMSSNSIPNVDWRTRLHTAIPGGAHTYSRGDDQYPQNAPPILKRAKGAYVWDPEGRRYLDYGMALRAVTIGYADPRVNAAAIEAIEAGVNLTRASTVELEAAETFIRLIPSVEMVKFAKNGSNVTSAAVKIARSYTGRKFVCVPRQQPFFSFDDWFIGVTNVRRGVPPEHTSNTLVFDYGDIESLRKLFEEHPNEIAAVMLEPATTLTPCPKDCAYVDEWPNKSCGSCPNRSRNFLQQIRKLCDENGAVLIFDEMITGFRWHISGAQQFFEVLPDICTFGKGMANGFSVAAVGGRKELMQVGAINQPGQERTFLLSTTHGAEMPGLAAFVASAQIYEAEDVVGHHWRYGQQLSNALTEAALSNGIQDHFKLEGPAISLNFVISDASGTPSLAMRTLFSQEMIRNGVLMPCIAVSQAHGEDELKLTADAADASFKVLKKALEGKMEDYLVGPVVKPVFRSHN